MYQVIDDMAMLTASSQLRSSGRQGSATADDLIAFGQNELWQEILLNYTIEYAHHVKKDYLLFLNDFKKGVFKISDTTAKITNMQEKVFADY